MIQKNWDALMRPKTLNVDSGADISRQAKITVEPLERGFGLTLGNALRRVLMSSLQGAAVTGVRIDRVVHEFMSIKGIREDVTDIVLNLKDVQLSMEVPGPKRLNLKAKDAGAVRASAIQCSNGIEVLNPDHIICHLDEGASFDAELTVNVGKGYVSAEAQEDHEGDAEVIPIDAIFSPVQRVAYKVESAREGDKLDYDKLVLEIDTDGSVKPEDALAFAARIIQDQLRPFINFEDPAEEKVQDEPKVEEINPELFNKVEELELSVRAANCLKNDNIVYIGDLVLKSETDMLKTPNFGRKSLNEIKKILADLGLSLGMDNPDWPPDNLEELSKKHDESNY